jgi:arylsulfatase A-like enzyme
MPFVARWPKGIQPNTKISELTQNIDFAPTLLDAAGIEVPDDIQGRSFLPQLCGKQCTDWRKSLYYHYYEKAYGCPPHEGVVTDRYKLVHFYEVDEWEFYDRQADPYEMASRYFDPFYSEQVNYLKSELISLKKYYKVPE